MTPHERQRWIDEEHVAPVVETAEMRGQIIANGSLAEGRPIIAMLLSWRREIPLNTACFLLALAPVGLDLKASQAWVAAVAYSENVETMQ